MNNVSICLTLNSDKFIKLSEKNSNSDVISLHVYKNTPYKMILPLGLTAYCETNATTSPAKEKTYRIKDILQLI